MNPKTTLRIAYFLCVAGLALTVQARAEEDAQPVSRAENLLERVRELEKMRAEDPAAFQSLMSRKREEMRRRVEALPPEGREQFRSFMQNNASRRQAQFARFRQGRPELYERFMDRRFQKFNEAAGRNPGRFQNFLARHPNFQRQMQERRERQGGGGAFDRDRRRPAGQEPRGGRVGPRGPARGDGPGFRPGGGRRRPGQAQGAAPRRREAGRRRGA